MSTSVKIGLGLLASKGILPKKEMLKVFNKCLEELGLKVSNNSLIFGNEIIGTLSLKDRIILNIQRENVSKYDRHLVEIRELFALRGSIAQKDYIYKREQEIIRYQHDTEVYDKLKQELDRESIQMKKAMKLQKMDACDALKNELIEAAVNNGYEVEETTSGTKTQLQLVRIEY